MGPAGVRASRRSVAAIAIGRLESECYVAYKSRRGAGGAKDGDQGKCGPAKHVPGSEPDKRVTSAGSHTASRTKRPLCRHTPEVGAVCGKAARTVLSGGREATRVPTATSSYPCTHFAAAA